MASLHDLPPSEVTKEASIALIVLSHHSAPANISAPPRRAAPPTIFASSSLAQREANRFLASPPVGDAQFMPPPPSCHNCGAGIPRRGVVQIGMTANVIHCSYSCAAQAAGQQAATNSVDNNAGCSGHVKGLRRALTDKGDAAPQRSA